MVADLRSESPNEINLEWMKFLNLLVLNFFHLVEQVFFVLRKKQSQVTFLHIYHHSNMAVSTWAYLKYLKGKGQSDLSSYFVKTNKSHPYEKIG